MPERKIDDVDAEGRAVRDREVDGPDDIARKARAGLVEHFQDDELHFRRQPVIRVIRRQRAGAADDAGDVRSVAVVVER